MKKGKANIKQNVEISVLNREGKAKKIFNYNFLGRFLVKYFNIKNLFIFGSWENKIKISNLITSAGFAAMASRLNGSGGEDEFTYVALGSGNTVAKVSDTALETEITASGGARTGAAVSRTTTNFTNDTAQLTASFSISGDITVKESGVFNASSAGTMLARTVFSEIELVSGDTFALLWQFDFS